MPNQCIFTGKRTTFGNRIARSGAAVKTGGFGLKTSGISRRRFKPNLQKLTIVVDGKPVRATVSARAIRTGLVTKPLKRKYGYTAQKKAAAH
ncbi:MAG: 50S ribosomal protein L28 [Phycisphaerales bacterium]|nr:50S ribosomal protein L28 [Phycisphaerales bacterium]